MRKWGLVKMAALYYFTETNVPYFLNEYRGTDIMLKSVERESGARDEEHINKLFSLYIASESSSYTATTLHDVNAATHLINNCALYF